MTPEQIAAIRRLAEIGNHHLRCLEAQRVNGMAMFDRNGNGPQFTHTVEEVAACPAMGHGAFVIEPRAWVDALDAVQYAFPDAVLPYPDPAEDVA